MLITPNLKLTSFGKIKILSKLDRNFSKPSLTTRLIVEDRVINEFRKFMTENAYSTLRFLQFYQR